jgi:hypothetical protein
MQLKKISFVVYQFHTNLFHFIYGISSSQNVILF